MFNHVAVQYSNNASYKHQNHLTLVFCDKILCCHTSSQTSRHGMKKSFTLICAETAEEILDSEAALGFGGWLITNRCHKSLLCWPNVLKRRQSMFLCLQSMFFLSLFLVVFRPECERCTCKLAFP